MPLKPNFPPLSRWSFFWRVLGGCALSTALATLAGVALYVWQKNVWLSLAIATGTSLAINALWLAPMWGARMSLLRALASVVQAYRDHDYSFAIHWPGHDEFRALVDAHAELGDALRTQRMHLVQRELLLDTMTQNSPVATILAVQDGPILVANLAARAMLANGESLEGTRLDALSGALRGKFLPMLHTLANGVFSVESEDGEELYHLSTRSMQLQARNHQLILLRAITQEVHRQEVKTWKKVLRVLSHELNNSLAPIRSLAHTGKAMLERGMLQSVPQTFSVIAERAQHLEAFLQSYAAFAKLPAPRMGAFDWAQLIASLQAQYPFTLQGTPPQQGYADRAQLEQALLNGLKNAHESGSELGQIALSVSLVEASAQSQEVRIDITDGGPGMSETVMAQALVPFYSTKRSGTGIGLALMREIVEAHGGRLSISNRAQGGLLVRMHLPQVFACAQNP
jgi:two-component system, NtrC family, nitrogen regulation sensor histidine kinase NtrY